MDTISKTFFALGTLNTIQAFGCPDERAVDRAVDRVYEIHNRMSVFQEGSDVFRLNANAGVGPQTVHPDTLYLLSLAKKYAKLSSGAFDVTIRPLSALWDIGKRGDFIPSDAEIKKAMQKTGTRSLIIHAGKSAAELAQPGMSVDLGGIAKGFAGDEVKRILKEGGVANALINLGGNIVAMGSRPDGTPWTVGIQNPLRPRGESLLSLPMQDSSVVTSGSYERFFMKDGVRYHHILDPRTGFPAQGSLLSVTVISPSSVEADALSTALFVMGLYALPKEGAALLKKSGAQAIAVTQDMKIIHTGEMPRHQLKGCI